MSSSRLLCWSLCWSLGCAPHIAWKTDRSWTGEARPARGALPAPDPGAPVAWSATLRPAEGSLDLSLQDGRRCVIAAERPAVETDHAIKVQPAWYGLGGVAFATGILLVPTAGVGIQNPEARPYAMPFFILGLAGTAWPVGNKLRQMTAAKERAHPEALLPVDPLPADCGEAEAPVAVDLVFPPATEHRAWDPGTVAADPRLGRLVAEHPARGQYHLPLAGTPLPVEAASAPWTLRVVEAGRRPVEVAGLPAAEGLRLVGPPTASLGSLAPARAAILRQALLDEDRWRWEQISADLLAQPELFAELPMEARAAANARLRIDSLHRRSTELLFAALQAGVRREVMAEGARIESGEKPKLRTTDQVNAFYAGSLNRLTANQSFEELLLRCLAEPLLPSLVGGLGMADSPGFQASFPDWQQAAIAFTAECMPRGYPYSVISSGMGSAAWVLGELQEISLEARATGDKELQTALRKELCAGPSRDWLCARYPDPSTVLGEPQGLDKPYRPPSSPSGAGDPGSAGAGGTAR